MFRRKVCVMDKLSGTAVSRRTMLKATVATVGFGAVLIASQSLGGTSAHADDSTAYDLPTAAEIDQYLSSVSKPGFTDLAGIRAEYLDASVNFPFALPAGGTFPANSSLRNSDSDSDRKMEPETWERGIGIAEAYFVWQAATVSAAHHAQSDGNSVESNRLLDALDAGYASPVRKAILEDPDGHFPSAIDQARKGDFTSLAGLAA